MKNIFRKTLSFVSIALLLFSFTSCNILYESAIKDGINAEFQAVKDAANSEDLPDSRIVNLISKQITFPGVTLSESEAKELTQALLKNFDAQVESVSINNKAGTATALCKMSNVNMESVATIYASKSTDLTEDELIALTWTGKGDVAKDSLDRYLEALHSADVSDRMESSLTIPLTLEDGQWVPDFSGKLTSGFYNAVLGGYEGSLTSAQSPLILASYNALFNKLSGITAEEFSAGKYITHPLLAYMDYSLTSELDDELLSKFCVALLKNFSGTADSVTFTGNIASLNCTFTNGNMLIAMNQSEEFIEAADTALDDAIDKYIYGTMTYEQLEAEADRIVADLYTQYFTAIESIPETDFLVQKSTVPLTKKTDMWIADKSSIKEDNGLFNAMFGNLMDTSQSETDGFSPIYSS